MKHLTKKPVFIFIILTCCTLLINAQETSQAFSSDEINEFKSLFIQIAALMGMAIVVFLFVNFRSNKLRRKKPEKFNLQQAKQQVTEAPAKASLHHAVDLIPYPACVINKDEIPEYFNSLFEKQVNLPLKTILSQHFKVSLKILEESSTPAQASTNNNAVDYFKTSTNRFLKITRKAINSDQGERSILIIEDVSYLEDRINLIEERKKYFRYVIDQSMSSIFITNVDGQIIEINENAEQWTNCDKPSLLKTNMSTFIPGELLEQYNKSIFQSLQTLCKCQLTEFSFLINNKSIPVDITLSTIDYFDTKANIIIVKDVTDRVQHEHKLKEAQLKAEESDRLKSTFLANMSHEVRTPMNSIMGFSELMCDNQLSDKERREFHQIVKNSAQELLNLLDDIIEFSKIESGQIQLKTEQLHPAALINELKEHTNELLKNKPNIQLAISAPIGFEKEPVIHADHDRIAQVLRNLLDNAVKFTYDGSITIGYQYRSDSSIDLFVKDTGIGIPAKKISKIFHKFRQADEANNRGFGGAGLGLSLSQQLAKHMNGYLWVDSQEHKGSTFHFIIPPNLPPHKVNIKDRKTILIYGESLPAELTELSEKEGSYSLLRVNDDLELCQIPVANSIAHIILCKVPPKEVLEQITNCISKEKVVTWQLTNGVNDCDYSFKSIRELEELELTN